MHALEEVALVDKSECAAHDPMMSAKWDALSRRRARAPHQAGERQERRDPIWLLDKSRLRRFRKWEARWSRPPPDAGGFPIGFNVHPTLNKGSHVEVDAYRVGKHLGNIRPGVPRKRRPPCKVSGETPFDSNCTTGLVKGDREADESREGRRKVMRPQPVA